MLLIRAELRNPEVAKHLVLKAPGSVLLRWRSSSIAGSEAPGSPAVATCLDFRKAAASAGDDGRGDEDKEEEEEEEERDSHHDDDDYDDDDDDDDNNDDDDDDDGDDGSYEDAGSLSIVLWGSIG